MVLLWLEDQHKYLGRWQSLPLGSFNRPVLRVKGVKEITHIAHCLVSTYLRVSEVVAVILAILRLIILVT